MNPMMFTDPAFLFCFAPVVITLYRVLSPRLHNGFLLAASLAFYAWGEGLLVWVLCACMAVNYVGGFVAHRKGGLIAGILLNLCLLGWFKYAGFFIENVDLVLAKLGMSPIPIPSISLPVGISFFTFMGMSYLIDIYWKQIDVERNPAIFGLYISLFPHLIAGPIVRFSSIAAQLHRRHTTPSDIVIGIRRFIIGFGKKMLIGNTVGVAADAIFNLPANRLTTSTAWLGVLCYTLQIYYDFSGYSDMAIGLARIFGFVFPENFNYPYLSRSITEFWRRWHISLSTWLRDYLFFPLGVRVPRLILYRNILIVFLLCGLWHGASWHFVVWGLWYGAFLVVERMGLLDFLAARSAVLSRAYTLAVVMAGWVLFRADTLSAAGSFFSALAAFQHAIPDAVAASRYLTTDLILALLFGIAGCGPLVPYLKEKLIPASLVGGLEFAAAAAVFVVCAALSAAGTFHPFIYFRF